MHVPIKVDYAVRALVDISLHETEGTFVRSADTAKRTSIPKAYQKMPMLSGLARLWLYWILLTI